MKYRTEKDTMGPVQVPADALWGSQTQRSLQNFPIGTETFPLPFIYTFAEIKGACARANVQLDLLSSGKGDAIGKAVEAVCSGNFDDQFPLSVWQTGSGTQTNMNLNEVIGNIASELLGGKRGEKSPVHPNDDVNKSQSSNDIFPAAMQLCTAKQLRDTVIPEIESFIRSLQKKESEFEGIVKCGRTHLQDATPITLSQEFSAYTAQLKAFLPLLRQSVKELLSVPVGGTAVGTGLNTHQDFASLAAEHLTEITGMPVRVMENKFAGLAAHDAFVRLSGILNSIAAALFKIANDIRWMGSGPRCGIGELLLPENEPGSSIMPGKVNPTQAEALTMICTQVMGNHTTISISGASGNFELNVFKPVIFINIWQSLVLLADGMNSFRKRCLEGLKADSNRIGDHLSGSLMLVTALNPVIGYEKSAEIAKKAYNKGISLREAAIESGHLSGDEYDKYVNPFNMTGPNITEAP